MIVLGNIRENGYCYKCKICKYWHKNKTYNSGYWCRNPKESEIFFQLIIDLNVCSFFAPIDDKSLGLVYYAYLKECDQDELFS